MPSHRKQLIFLQKNDELLKAALLLAAGANPRSSADGSKANPKKQLPSTPDSLPQSASPPNTSNRSVPLSDNKVKLLTLFPNIKEVSVCAEECKMLSSEVVEHLIEKMLTTALRWGPTINFYIDAGLVHLIGKMVDEVTYKLRPCGAPVRMIPREDDPLIEMQIKHEGKGEGAWVVGFKQSLRAGTVRGHTQLQYVQRVLKNGKHIFCGAIHIQGYNDGVWLQPANVEQARKEAFTLWCHNAKQQHYHEVWILLTNGREINRVTYKGANVPREVDSAAAEAHNPSASPKPYYDRMPCVDVYGTIM